MGPIGIFDSGYGGLTILQKIKEKLPQYDFIYLGDNARAPYGTRSFEVVYHFTLQAVEYLFAQGCELVILACNTASAKALRTIQQKDLARIDPNKRVLGIIRPTVETIDSVSTSKYIGVLGTIGTIQSNTYPLEMAKIAPYIHIYGEACPMWVPLVENQEYAKPGADYFVKQHIDAILESEPKIDTLILGCTHFPLLIDKIRKYTPEGVTIFSQGDCVADSLKNYLARHPEMDSRCSQQGLCTYYTTESSEKFKQMASIFLNEPINQVTTVEL